MEDSHKGRLPMPGMVDFDKAPFVAIWETTRSCDLACKHCRAEALRDPLPGELSTEEGFAVLDELGAMGTPICVLSGGDPAKRRDLCSLISRGKERGMRMATIPAATPLLTPGLVASLKDAGLDQIAFSLDGPDADLHDAFRGTPGAFERTLAGAAYAAAAGLPLQINTTFSSYNWLYFDAIAALVRSLKVVFWEVFFLVPMGRGHDLAQLNADQYEAMFEKLARLGRGVDFIVKVTEAPHYRRFLMQQRKTSECGHCSGHNGCSSRHEAGRLPSHMTRDFGPGGSIGLAPKGVNSGNGHLFISHCGDIYPSGFLPLACGNVRRDSIADIYRTHPVFSDLRNPELLRGKCGVCEFRKICGGSRARAYAMTGDYLGEEKFCSYMPRAEKAARESVH